MSEPEFQSHDLGDETLLIEIDAPTGSYRLIFPRDTMRNARLRAAIPGTTFDHDHPAWRVPLTEREALMQWIAAEQQRVPAHSESGARTQAYQDILERLKGEQRALVLAHALKATDGKLQIKTPYDETIVAHMHALSAIYRGPDLGWFVSTLREAQIREHLVPALQRLASHHQGAHLTESDPTSARRGDQARQRYEAIATLRAATPAPTMNAPPEGQVLWSLIEGEPQALSERVVRVGNELYHIVEQAGARWPDSNAGSGVYVTRVPVTDQLLAALSG